MRGAAFLGGKGNDFLIKRENSGKKVETFGRAKNDDDDDDGTAGGGLSVVVLELGFTDNY
jgi:hypothetical protein